MHSRLKRTFYEAKKPQKGVPCLTKIHFSIHCGSAGIRRRVVGTSVVCTVYNSTVCTGAWESGTASGIRDDDYSDKQDTCGKPLAACASAAEGYESTMSTSDAAAPTRRDAAASSRVTSRRRRTDADAAGSEVTPRQNGVACDTTPYPSHHPLSAPPRPITISAILRVNLLLLPPSSALYPCKGRQAGRRW